jgi:hypothetical protein
MDLHERILGTILHEPGTSIKKLGALFNLSDYRLKRVFRHIERDLTNRTLIHDGGNGVWVVPVDPMRCLGMDWLGISEGGYAQCSDAPKFADRRCYRHSSCENPEMTAFERKLSSVAGPSEPTAYLLGQLPLVVVNELIETLKDISPLTLRDSLRKDRFTLMLSSAGAFLRWKEAMRGSERDRWIPPEFAARHRASSGNTYEFSLKKYFVVLEVSAEATKEEVLKAWRKLSRRFHPDTRYGDEEKMKIINVAKERIFRMRGWDRQSRAKRREKS